MTIASENNKRIAKNVFFLYIRIIVIMLVQLYTSRIILESLGIEDYGIYNIVGAVVISLSFITGPLSAATQRFLNYELGKKNIEGLNEVFNTSLYIYFILSVIILIGGESIGLWFLNYQLEIPAERVYAANWVFQCSLITFVLNILNIPFNSLIIAYEKMSFYAYISIFEAIAKLSIAYFLIFTTNDKLILYGLLVMIVAFFITSIYKIYCNKYLPNLKIRIAKSNQKIKQLLSFSGWSLWGAMANMSAEQGINLLLNIFFGVTINAATGIANQIAAAINQFVTNLQTAFNPSIIKNYAQGNKDILHNLVCRSSKFSFIMLFMITCPILYNTEYLLYLWLGKCIPTYAPIFCQLMIVSLLIDSLAAPLWASVNATGKIKYYQLCISLSIFSNIIISYIFLKAGYPPSIVFIIKGVVTVCNFCIRLFFAKKLIKLSVIYYFKKALCRIVCVCSLIFILFSVIDIYDEGWSRLIQTTLLFFVTYLPLIYYIGLTKTERIFIKQKLIIKNKI